MVYEVEEFTRGSGFTRRFDTLEAAREWADDCVRRHGLDCGGRSAERLLMEARDRRGHGREVWSVTIRSGEVDEDGRVDWANAQEVWSIDDIEYLEEMTEKEREESE